MKKHLIVIGMTLILLFVGLSGCNEPPENQDTTQLSILLFNVEPSMINKGETANLIWNVTGATTVSIDNDIGDVSLSGTRIISPIQNTTYILTASNSDTSKTATTEIIVKNNIDNNQSSIENPTATIVTSMGTIKVELYKDKVPDTCENFIKLANDGFYDGLVFHRVMDDFMIQGGGFDADGTNKESPYGAIDLEINPEVRHVDGAMAMARTSDPNSATSQFYICDGAQSFLDDNYAAFGVVIDGIDVVRDIASVSTTTKNGMNDWPVDDVTINSIIIESQ